MAVSWRSIVFALIVLPLSDNLASCKDYEESWKKGSNVYDLPPSRSIDVINRKDEEDDQRRDGKTGIQSRSRQIIQS